MIVKKVNRIKFCDELQAAGVEIISIKMLDGTSFGAEITFAVGTDMDLVQSIIDAHDVTPILPPPTQDDFLIDLELRMTMLELGISL